MSRVCEITGKRTIVGNNVSHSMRHTKRTFLPNLQKKSMHSNILGRNVTLRLTTNAMRTIDKYNGIDTFMTTIKPRKTETFSDAAKKIRKLMLKKVAAAATA